MVEVFVESIRVNMTNYKRVVMLKEKTGERYLPIWIGHFEADAIAIPMQNVPVSRPLTHDMLVNAIDRLGGRCTRAEITRLENETFFATLAADQAGRHVEIDCRPSDAIAAAIRTRVPIFVNDEVMDLAGMVFDGSESASAPEGGRSGAVTQAESILHAVAARADAPGAEAESGAGEPAEAVVSADEPADAERTGDPSATVAYWPGAEPAAGSAPEPFDALPAVSEPVLAALRSAILEAARRRRSVIGPGDVLLGLLRQ